MGKGRHQYFRKSYVQEDKKLSDLPKWFLNRDDVIEILAKAYLEDVHLSIDDLVTALDSVFVTCTMTTAEVEDVNPEVTAKVYTESAKIEGFDTRDELMKHIEEHHEFEIRFIYNTKKRVWYKAEAETKVHVTLEEDGTDTDEPDTKEEPKREVLPGLSTDVRPGPGEAAPGNFGPRRVP